MRVLMLNDAAGDDAENMIAQARVEKALTEKGVAAEVVTARDAFHAFEAQAGGKIRGHRWNDWVNHAATTFDGYVRPYHTNVGRITAQIIQMVLKRNGIPVLFLPESGPACQVFSVDAADPEDWKSGWRLVLTVSDPASSHVRTPLYKQMDATDFYNGDSGMALDPPVFQDEWADWELA